MTSLHRHFHCFLKILIFIAGGNDSFVVKNKFRAFWCLICLCSWIRSYLPPKISTGSHGRTMTSSAVYPLSLISLVPAIQPPYPTWHSHQLASNFIVDYFKKKYLTDMVQIYFYDFQTECSCSSEKRTDKKLTCNYI